jgi:hypothetical protein
MEILHTMTTVTEVLNELRWKKLDNEFRWNGTGLSIAGQETSYRPDDLIILDIYRFEGMSDPSDRCILYLLKARDGVTGYSLDSYGIYSNYDEGYHEFMRGVANIREALVVTQEVSYTRSGITP